MADMILYANSGEVSCTSGVEKTVLQIKAAAQQRVVVQSLSILGKSAPGGSNVPAFVRLTRCLTSGYGTASASAVVGKADSSQTETIQTVVGKDFSTQPTGTTDTGWAVEVQLQGGVIIPLPFNGAIKIPGGQALNVAVTTGAAETVLVLATFEE